MAGHVKAKPKAKKSDRNTPVELDQATRDSIARSIKLANMALALDSFPTFASQAEAEAYTDKTGDAYYEICYWLEGNLNLCIKAMHDLYANAPANEDRKYPLDSEASLKVHCRSICGLTKSKKGKSADKLPEGWAIAEKLFTGMGK